MNKKEGHYFKIAGFTGVYDTEEERDKASEQYINSRYRDYNYTAAQRESDKAHLENGLKAVSTVCKT